MHFHRKENSDNLKMVLDVSRTEYIDELKRNEKINLKISFVFLITFSGIPTLLSVYVSTLLNVKSMNSLMVLTVACFLYCLVTACWYLFKALSSRNLKRLNVFDIARLQVCLKKSDDLIKYLLKDIKLSIKENIRLYRYKKSIF